MYEDLVASLRKEFLTGRTLPLSFRIDQLHRLCDFMAEEQEAMIAACKADLRKPRSETLLTEVGMVLGDAAAAINHLHEWAAPVRPTVPLLNAADRCQIRSEPLGVVLIIGAWNYPIQLTLVPLVGAIAAGCCAVVKPSEVSPATAELLERLENFLDKRCFRVVNGGVAETTGLLRQRWDHIFYTGSGSVGKIVMKAAAEHLTSVTLELGGKSPCVIDSRGNVDIAVAARRLTWGRFINCGQTWIAPDYVLLTDASLLPDLVKGVKATLLEFYGSNPQASADYGRIVNERHVERLEKLLTTSQGTIEVGGVVDKADRFVAPTLITGVQPTDAVMADEIFGPILPVLVVPSVDAAIDFINARDKPLAMYVFSTNAAHQERLLAHTSSGSALVNDTLMQVTVDAMPFGGVGPSGMGAYHGKSSFDVFSHRRSLMVKDLSLEAVNAIRYPKYSDDKLKWLTWALFPARPARGSGVASLLSFRKALLLAALFAFLYSRS